MALIDLALLETGKVFVNTEESQDANSLLEAGALSAPTTIFYGAGDINLNSLLGVNALSAKNIVATGGAQVTIGSGLLNVSALTQQNLLIDGGSSITMDAAAVSVAGGLTDLLNKTTIAFSGSGAGTFRFNPPAIGLLSNFTIDVDEMGPGDKIQIPYGGDGLFALREPKALGGLGSYNGYDAKTGYLTLTNGAVPLNTVNVRIKMTQQQYDRYAGNRDQYLNGSLDTFTFPGTVDPNDPEQEVPCFTRGTLIQTSNGPVAIEDLSVGDLVLTRDNGEQEVRWVGSRKVSPRTLLLQPKLRPVRIQAGALGEGLPSADLVVSPQHRILLRSRIALRMFGVDEVLVAAKQLLQVEGIDIVDDLAQVEYFHILFDRHEIVVSNGADTESLYIGSEALKAVGPAARDEILELFPQLRDLENEPVGARKLLSGREGRKLAVRHLQNERALVS